MSKKSSIEKNPDFNFKTISELSHLSLEDKEKILADLEFIISECELSRKTVQEDCERNGIEVDPHWLKRVNYKIGVKRSQKKMLNNHLRVERGQSLIDSFYEISKIMLPEDTFNSILHKAKELSRKTRGED